MSKYAGGYFAVPGSTGDLTVTINDPELVPHTVIFFGSNQATEDSVVTTAEGTLFMGMMARQSGGTWLERANAYGRPTSQAGGSMNTRGDCCILCVTDHNNGTQYKASAVSSAAGSFTVNFSTVAASRIVHYLVIGDSVYDAVFNQLADQTTTVGFKARSMFHIGGYAFDGGGFNYENTGLAFMFWGGATYYDPITYFGDASSLSIADYGGFSQWWERMGVWGPGAPAVISQGVHFLGPFMGEDNHVAGPTSATQFRNDVSGYGDSALFSVWDGDSDVGTGTPSGTATATTNFPPTHRTGIPVDALIIFGANGNQGGPATVNGPGSVLFGVWTPEYEGCCGLGNGGYLYQSRNKSWVSAVDATGVVAGTITPAGGGFDATTVVGSTTSHEISWFGPIEDVELPQIYRRTHTVESRRR